MRRSATEEAWAFDKYDRRSAGDLRIFVDKAGAPVARRAEEAYADDPGGTLMVLGDANTDARVAFDKIIGEARATRIFVDTGRGLRPRLSERSGG